MFGSGNEPAGAARHHQWVKTVSSSSPTGSGRSFGSRSFYPSSHHQSSVMNLIDGSNENNLMMMLDQHHQHQAGAGARIPNQTAVLPGDRAAAGHDSGTKPKKTHHSWIVRNCPPSLRFIVRFYQFMGFSFAGIVFVDDYDRYYAKNIQASLLSSGSSIGSVGPRKPSASSKIFHTTGLRRPNQARLPSKPPGFPGGQDPDEQRFGNRLQRISFLALNVLGVAIVAGILITNIWQQYQKEQEKPADGNSSEIELASDGQQLTESADNSSRWGWFSWQEFISPITNINEHQAEIGQLKPILRLIIESLLYVLLFDNLVMGLYLLVRGGRLVRLLIRIPNIDLFDYSRRFAYRSMGILLVVACIINVLGVISFNTGEIDELLQPSTTVWGRVYIVLVWIRNVILFIYLSVVSLCFIYTMMLFKFAIERLLNTLASVNLDEIHMLKLKTKLSNLNDQFKEIIPCFALPLTVNFASNIFIIISSACFLMINSNTRIQYMSFVFSLGLFAFLRLIVVACVGNLPTNVCRDLIRTVYENLEQWSLNEWMCFMELKRLRKEFTVSIFSMYTVRQSSILAMLGFALNYIVILLQTENYGTNTNGTMPAGAPGAPADNLTEPDPTKQPLLDGKLNGTAVALSTAYNPDDLLAYLFN